MNPHNLSLYTQCRHHSLKPTAFCWGEHVSQQLQISNMIYLQNCIFGHLITIFERSIWDYVYHLCPSQVTWLQLHWHQLWCRVLSGLSNKTSQLACLHHMTHTSSLIVPTAPQRMNYPPLCTQSSPIWTRKTPMPESCTLISAQHSIPSSPRDKWRNSSCSSWTPPHVSGSRTFWRRDLSLSMSEITPPSASRWALDLLNAVYSVHCC